MTAWGEFAFITAATAKEAGIIDAELFELGDPRLSCLSVVTARPVPPRLVIVRNQKEAVASIASAKEHAARGGGTGDVPVYYRLQTRSAPSWGLNARLMDIVTTNSLQTLGARSTCRPRRQRAVPQGPVLSAAPAATLPRAQEAALQQRIASLLAEISRLFSDGGKVKLERWLPTDGGDPAADLAAVAGDALALHLEARPDEHARRRRRRRRRRTASVVGAGRSGPSAAAALAAARGARLRMGRRGRRVRRGGGLALRDPAEGTGYKSQKPRDLGGYVTAAPAPGRARTTGLLGGGGRRRRQAAAAPRQQWPRTDGRRHGRLGSEMRIGWADLEMILLSSDVGTPSAVPRRRRARLCAAPPTRALPARRHF